MRRAVVILVAAVLVGAAAGPAAPDAKVREGDVTLWVRGRGTLVESAGGTIAGHQEGVKASLIAFPPRGHWYKVTAWRPVSWSRSTGMTMHWTLHKPFVSGTRLCLEANDTADRPCARIHH